METFYIIDTDVKIILYGPCTFRIYIVLNDSFTNFLTPSAADIQYDMNC